MRPRIVPNSKAVEAEAMFLFFFLPLFSLLLLLLAAQKDLDAFVLVSDNQI